MIALFWNLVLAPHSLQPPPPSPSFCRGVEPSTQFSKRGEGFDRTSVFGGGVAGKKGVTFFRGDHNFYIINELKSEIFNDKNSL